MINLGRNRTRISFLAISAAGLGLALAGCGSSSSGAGGAAGGSTLAPQAPPAANATNVSVQAKSSGSFGSILMTTSGKTLYEFTPDQPGQSVCTGGCATAWPPLTVGQGAKVVAGAGIATLSTISRADGSKQVAINGHPLYLFAGDKSPGQTNGEGSEGTWFVVSPTGAMIRHAASSSSAPSTTASSAPAGGSGGYGY